MITPEQPLSLPSRFDTEKQIEWVGYGLAMITRCAIETSYS